MPKPAAGLDPAPDPVQLPAPAQSLASRALGAVLWAGLLFMLGANLPGHMSLDSVTQLHEGRAGVRETWAPATMSWLLGRFDDLVPGTGLYVTASALILTLSLLSLRTLRPRTSWPAVALGLGMVLTPALIIYQAIVWKDVLFTNLAIAGFVCLAHAARSWADRRSRLLPVAGALLMFAFGALIRQNGVLALGFAALALAWTARAGGWRASLGWFAGFLLAGLVLIQVIGAAVQPPGSSSAEDTRRGVRVLQHYDIVGALAHDPGLKLDIIQKAAPLAWRTIRLQGPRAYTPERVDTFGAVPALGQSLWPLPDAVVADQWRDIVLHHPGAYLAHRFDVFVWTFATPIIDRCLPIQVGVEGSPEKLKDLNIPSGVEPQDQSMVNYATWFFDTPLYSHLTYAVIALLVAGFLLWRRDPADVLVAGLQLSALAFTASFLLISVACDYRYLYFLDVAAMSGLLYVALDPTLRRGGR